MEPISFPSQELVNWYEDHKRDLPWRATRDPYAIWISEIMLQQTRVDTVIPYYQRWMEAFPDVKSLAEADQQKVLKVWEGLGYYSRARNAHQAAQSIVSEYGGTFPDKPDQIAKLRGIGPYTTAAISSIAFDQDLAVVDGNVIRVLSRYFHIEEDIRRPKVVKEIQHLADSILLKGDSGRFNQAMMELGATVCKPKQPLCLECPISSHCLAFREASVERLPYKSPAKKIPHHTISVGIILNEKGNILIAQRPEKAMLGGLWEFPGGKVETGEKPEEALVRELREEIGVDVEIVEFFHSLDHTYSHFKITLMAWIVKIVEGEPKPNSAQGIRWVNPAELVDYPFPKANRQLTLLLMERF